MNRALYFYNEDRNSKIDNHSMKGRFVLYTSSHAIIECKMDFTFYPFDTQKCKLRMSTWIGSKFLGSVIRVAHCLFDQTVKQTSIAPACFV